MNRRNFLAAGAALLAGSRGAAQDDNSKADELHRKSTVIVVHDHRPIAADVPLMLAGGVTAKVYQLGVDVEIGREFRNSGRDGWARRTRTALNDAVQTIRNDPKRVVLALTADDIERAKRDGKVAIMLGVEGGKLLEGDLEQLREFHRLGLRELQLRWAVPNQIVEQDTLTDFGMAVVKECQRLGIIVDLTHIPEKAFFQTIELATKPLIVSHGTGRGDLGEKRLKALADRHGVVGIHFYSSYLGRRPSVLQVLDHIDFVARTVGTDTIALGVDFFPTEGKWREFQEAQGTKDIAWAIPDMSHMREVTRGLVARSYSDRQIEGILGGNFLRVCKEVMAG